jgi:hypothetical protein
MSEAEVLTPEMAREEAAAMNADKDHPLRDPGHMKHPQAIDRLQTLLTAHEHPLETVVVYPGRLTWQCHLNR